MKTCGTMLRCTISFLLLTVAALLWEAGSRLLPEDHPTRAFALGAAAQVRPARRACRFTPNADVVPFGAVWAWTGAVLGSSALLVCELGAATNILWDGHLPGLPV